MSTLLKEFREFFTRNTQVTRGSKADQENGFPITYNIGVKTVFNRFLKGNYPSEDVWKKLFNSITFKLNLEDTADSTNQGLVRIATDTVAINRTIKSSTDFATVVVPEHLPEVITGNIIDPYTTINTNTANGIKVTKVNKNLGNSRTRADYNISLDGSDTVPGGSINSVYGNIDNGDGVRKKQFVDINTLATKVPSGAIMIWNSATPPAGWYICNGGNGTPDLGTLRIGTTYFIMKS